MATRCNIRFVTNDNAIADGALYHHYDGYPEFMLPKLEKFLTKAKELLKNDEQGYERSWWIGSAVASTLSMLSIEDYNEPLLPFSTKRANSSWDIETPDRPRNGLPCFVLCDKIHDDIGHLYTVVIDSENHTFEISHKKV